MAGNAKCAEAVWQWVRTECAEAVWQWVRTECARRRPSFTSMRKTDSESDVESDTDTESVVVDESVDFVVFTSKSVPASTRLEDPSKKGAKRTAKSAPINPCPSREGPYSAVFR